MPPKVLNRFVIPLLLAGLMSHDGHGAPTGVTSAQNPSDKTIRTLQEAGKSPHPRLFLKAEEVDALRKSIPSDSRMTVEYQQLISRARKILKDPPVTRKLDGRRLLRTSRICLDRVSILSMAWRLEHDPAFLARAREEMLAAASFTDWNPSHFLDVAEMTAALAIGYDWLYPDLDDATKDTIRKAIVSKGLEPGVSQPEGKEHRWFRGRTNWNQVCNGGLVLGALAVSEDYQDLSSKIISRGLESVPFALKSYAPAGVYPEGPSYWAYGTTYSLLMISALQSALGTDFGLPNQPGFLESAEFMLHATGPSERYFDFSDCRPASSIQPAIFWISSSKKDPSLLWNMERRLDAKSLETVPFLPFQLLWSHPGMKANLPASLDWSGGGPNPVAFFRSDWGKDALYAAIKGGSPSLNHAHMDVGSFVFDALGTRWVHDLGGQDYNGLEQLHIDLWNMHQDSARWRVFRLSNHSHNNLVINGGLQNVAGKASLIAHGLGTTNPSATVDCSEIFAGQAARVERTLSLPQRNSLLIEDRVNEVSAAGNIRWQIMTDASVSTEASRAVLSKEGKSIVLNCDTPVGASWQVSDASAPVHPYDAPNPGMHQVFFEIPVKKGDSVAFKITLQPQTAKPETNKAPMAPIAP